MAIESHKWAAFSLVEVVVALGIFAVGIVGVLGLLAPITDSVATNRQAETAARVVEAVHLCLRSEAFATVATSLLTSEQLKTQESSPDYNPAVDDRLWFASVSGEKVGRRDDVVWQGSDREKFFEITLVRNETLSPEESDPVAATLAYTVRVRWPLFIATAPGEFDPRMIPVGQHARHVALFTGAVRR